MNEGGKDAGEGAGDGGKPSSKVSVGGIVNVVVISVVWI